MFKIVEDGLTFGGRESFFFSSTDSFVGVEGFTTTTGFFFTVGTGLDGTDLIIGTSTLTGFFATVVVVDVADGSGRKTIGAAERGSPRRLSRTDFSAYSLI